MSDPGPKVLLVCTIFLYRYFLEMKRYNNIGSFLFAKKANNFQKIAAHVLVSFLEASQLVQK